MRFGLDNEFFQVYNYIKLGVIAALAIFGLVLCLADGDSAHEWNLETTLSPYTCNISAYFRDCLNIQYS